MSNVPVPARQLVLTPITSDGDPAGPVVHFPGDWPSAVPVIDLTEATLDEAVERWREWVTADRPDLVVDALVLHQSNARIVVIEGREFRATLDDPEGVASETPVPSGTPGQRRAIAGELCSCGRQAILIYETEQFGDVAYCGIPDGGAG